MSSLRSECALRSLGLFGLTTDDAARHEHDLVSATAARAAGIDRSLRAGQLALITGPSAAGKSSILRTLARQPHSIAPYGINLSLAQTTVIDALSQTPQDLPAAMRVLSASGLADAFLPSRPVAALSEGERARFRIARAMLGAEHALARAESPTILLDDFADNLDDATAISVSHALRRWLAAHPRARIIIATLRPHLAAFLCPDLVLDLGTPALRAGSSLPSYISEPDTSLTSTEHAVVISSGTLTDYDALAHHHYRAGRPATIAAVLVARFTHHPAHTRLREPGNPDHPAAVLTISMPTLNGVWRSRAWPDLASSALNKRAAARELNRTLRCISRIIVHPHHRACGLASHLIRHYLADPLTPRTEALSAMGAISPLFTHAGMTEWLIPHAMRDLKLIDALSAADLRPWMLADIDLALERIDRFPHLDRALRIWATAHGHTRPLAHAPPRDLIRAAAKHIITPRRAYTHG